MAIPDCLHLVRCTMRKLILTLLLVIVFAFPSKVSADAAPPSQPPGANPQPGTETTQVRMVSETVIIDVLQDTPSDSMGQAKVTADFTMRNLGNQSESLAVRFPMGANNGYGTWENIKNINVKVNSKTVQTHVINGAGDDASFGFSEEIPWVVFDVNFPLDQDVLIQVSYTLEAWGDMPFVEFDYIFATGAGWKDTIGSATLIVNFPYEISNLNILPDQYGNEIITYKSATDQLTWMFTDFEPQTEDNFEIDMVAPSVWKSVLNEQSNAAANPNDGEAWGRLGKLYKQIAYSARGKGFRAWTFFEDKGAQELFRLSTEAYQKAVSLKPDDPLWHAGFAELLGYYAFWARNENINARPQAYRALEEIQSALELAPEDPKVLEIAENLVYELEGGLEKNGDTYQFPGLTATPMLPTIELPKETETPVTVIQPTNTFQPVSTLLDETPTSPPKASLPANKGLPLCGSLLLAPFGFIFWIVFRKIRV